MSLKLHLLSHRSRKAPTRKRDRRPRCPLLDYRRADPDAALHVWRLDERRRKTERATHPHGTPIVLDFDATVIDAERAIAHLGPGRYRIVARAARISGRQDYEARYPGAFSIPVVRRPSDAERLRLKLDAAREARRGAEAEREAALVEVTALRAEVTRWKQKVRVRDDQLAALEARLEASRRQLETARKVYGPADRDRRDRTPEAGGHTEAKDPIQTIDALIERFARLGVRLEQSRGGEA